MFYRPFFKTEGYFNTWILVKVKKFFENKIPLFRMFSRTFYSK